MKWRRARKNERCGFCPDHVFKGGEPVFLYGDSGLLRCAAIAKSRYGQPIPVPFPEPEAEPSMALRVERQPDFATPRSSVPQLRAMVDAKQRQTGETE